MKFFEAIAKRYALSVTLWAAVYWTVARASLLLAIPGSNASPVWPPSGLALALLLIGGTRWWPAILLGAFAANVQGFASHGEVTLALQGAALTIAVGNTLEAVLATWLLRKLVGKALVFTKARHVVGFAVIAPLACLVSAGVGVASLLVAKAIPFGLWSAVLQTWWLGDLSGMVVLTPFLLSWYPSVVKQGQAYPQHASIDRWFLAVVVCAVGVLAAVFVMPFDNASQSRPFLILFFPLLGVMAWRYGLRGGSAAMVTLVSLAIGAALYGRGLLELGPVTHVLVQLNVLLILFALVNLLLAADSTEDHANKSLGGSAQRCGSVKKLSWGALCLACGLSVMAWHWVALGNENQARRHFQNDVQDVVEVLDNQVKIHQRALASAAGLFIGRNRVERSTWHAFVLSDAVGDHLPGIQGFGFAEWIAPGHLDALNQRMQQEGFASFAVKPPGVRNESTAIVMLEPMNARNQRAFGFDMWSEATRRQAMRTARDSGKIATTARVKLLQENGEDEQAGFLMYYPVYRTGEAVDTASQRAQHILGFVYAPFRASHFVHSALGNAYPHLWIDIADHSGDAPLNGATALQAPAAERIYPAPGKPSEPQTGQVGKLEAIRILDVGQHQWRIRITSLDHFWSNVDQTTSQFILVAGMLLSVFLFGLVRIEEQTHEQAQAIAQRMASAYQDVRSSLESLVNTASVAVVVADQHGVVQRWNPAAITLFGSGLLGRQVRLEQLVLPADTSDIEAAMASWAQDTAPARTKLRATAVHEDGLGTVVNLSLSSWGSGNLRMYGAIFQDMSEQQRADEFERGLFEEALDAMLIAQADGRIVQANKRAAQVLGYPREVLETMVIEDFVPLSVRHGHQALREGYAHNASRRAMGSSLELHALHAMGYEFPIEMALNTLQLGHTPHYVATIVDISVRKAAEKQLQSTLAFQSSMQRNAALSIIATDLHGTILIFNHAAERMLGYSARDMVGLQTPAVLHDPSEVVARAHTLSQELGCTIEPGFEVFVALARQGKVDEREWTYVRKDGQRVPVRLSVTGLFDDTGALTGFLGMAADIREAKQHEQAMKAALLEKETLLREVYHRVKNNLQVVGSLFNLQQRSLPEGVARNALFEAAQRVQSMALVHEKLYQSNTLSSIRMADYVQDLCKQIMHVSGAEPRGIALQTRLADLPLGLDQAVPLGLLINELMTNSIKHAFGPEGGILSVTVASDNDLIVLEIADNGKGFADVAALESARSLGLRLARTLTQQLDGTLVRENRQGAYSKISFPVVAVTKTTRGV